MIVIPARLASTRLPNKLLLAESGKPLLQHTYEAAQKATVTDEVVVAADDPSIVDAVKSFGGRVELTRTDHQSGTDRLAEIAERYPDVEWFINVQGDEPEIDALHIDQAAKALFNDPSAHMSTLATPIHDESLLHDTACVKVVFDESGRALYFSRSAIPFPRDGYQSIIDQCPSEAPGVFFQHVGLYVYRRETLLELTKASRPTIEVSESLEQLRALYLNKTILVEIVPSACKGVDTLDDYRAFVSRVSSC